MTDTRVTVYIGNVDRESNWEDIMDWIYALEYYHHMNVSDDGSWSIRLKQEDAVIFKLRFNS